MIRQRPIRQVAVVVLAGLAAVACSGGETNEETSDAAGPATTPPESTAPDQSDVSPATAPPATTSPATTSPATTTTTTVPPEPYRAGVVFDDPVEVLAVRPGLGRSSSSSTGGFHVVDLGDELWVISRQWNSSAAARSLDDGLTWTEVTFGPPPGTGETVVEHVARGTDGRYVAIAGRESSCRDAVAIDGGFTSHFVCTQRRPVVFVSDDAATWTESAPAGLAPPDGSSLRINDLTVVGDRFVAAGTIEGSGWRAVLFSSPDGVTWTNEREIVGDGNPMSSSSLAYDGTTLVLIADETPCDGVNFNTGGWDLGAGAARHGRIFVGADIASLTLQQPSDHPLAGAPFVPPDPSNPCGPVDGIPFHFAGVAPTFEVELIDGTLTVFDRGGPRGQREQLEAARDADDEELYNELVVSIGSRRWAELIDGEWVVTDIEGVNVAAGSWASNYASGSIEVGAGGDPASISTFTSGSPVFDVFTVTDDDPAQVRSITPVVFARRAGIIGVDDGYLLVGFQARDPFLPYIPGDPATIVAWRTSPGEDSPAGRCDLERDGYCMFNDLREHPDYPDFSGRDLAGVNLTGTDIGEADFSGADLSGARLWRVTSDRNPEPSFVGADLTDAELQEAEMGDISGATVDGASFVGAEILRADGVDFSNAVMFDAKIWYLMGVTLGNTDLTGARLDIVDEFPDLTTLNYETIEISLSPDYEGSLEFDLSGLDLTGVSFGGWLSSEPVVITSLEGTVLSDTRFTNADLTQLDPTTFDLSLITPGFGLICPDGGEAEGLPRSCVREG